MNFTKLFFFIFMNVCLAAVPVQAADKTLQNKDYTITIPESLNGVMNLGDNQYAMWGDFNAAEEYETMH